MSVVIGAVASRYPNFSARARRGEYWGFVLVSMIIYAIVGGIEYSLRAPMTVDTMFYFTTLAQLLLLIPTFAVSIRRLHDLDKSGWWILIAFVPILGSIYLFVIFCMRGTKGDNRYGADPLDNGQPVSIENPNPQEI